MEPSVETETSDRRQRFDALFREHVRAIASYCHWRSTAGAGDAVAEVFMAAWRRLDDVPAGEAARAWLYATARRVLANQARADARRTRLGERLNAQPAPMSVVDNPLAGRVHEALARLDPHDREVLLLAEWEGLTPTEIAKVMHRPPVTIRVRLHRARRRFRASFEATVEPGATTSSYSEGASCRLI
jgi:RNA polymerase sigma factor (sigma-70 family)